MQVSEDEIRQVHAEGGCTCCGRKLNPKTFRWLEKSWSSGRWFAPGKCPEAESQGMFAFGQACARRVVREQKA